MDVGSNHHRLKQWKGSYKKALVGKERVVRKGKRGKKSVTQGKKKGSIKQGESLVT
jgi:hypothetical protein